MTASSLSSSICVVCQEGDDEDGDRNNDDDEDTCVVVIGRLGYASSETAIASKFAMTCNQFWIYCVEEAFVRPAASS